MALDLPPEVLLRAVQEILPKSEKLDRELILRSFVDMGHAERLTSATSQYIFGRRGTGKTHLFTYLCENINASVDRDDAALAIYIDARNVVLDSNPADLPARSVARSLFREFLKQLISELRTLSATLLWHNDVPTARSAEARLRGERSHSFLDAAFEAIHDAKPTSGSWTACFERKQNRSTSSTTRRGLKSILSGKQLALGAELSTSSSDSTTDAATFKETGLLSLKIDYERFREAIKGLLDINNKERLYIFIDEWSQIDKRAQPFLAEYIKKCFFTDQRFAIKIATLPFQTSFNSIEDGQPVGFDRHGDIFLGIDLDDDLVFVKNADRVRSVFSELLLNHLRYAVEKIDPSLSSQLPDSPAELIEAMFSATAYDRLLAFSQGNARDFLTLFQRAFFRIRPRSSPTITITALESAAKDFGIERLDNVREHGPAFELFNQIVNHVLRKERQGAFLLEDDLANNDLILYLIHQRLLHVWDRSYSSPSHSGKRFLVISIDHCVVVEHLKSPNYRHILKNLELPFSPEAERQLRDARRETASARKREDRLLRLEPPDKRSVRAHVLPRHFLVDRANLTVCPFCRHHFERDHPVYVRLHGCPSCGSPLSTA